MKRPVSLLETVPYMIDERFEYRLIGEYFQAKIRLEELQKYFSRIPDCIDDKLSRNFRGQMMGMDMYINAMKERILYLGIDRIIEGGV